MVAPKNFALLAEWAHEELEERRGTNTLETSRQVACHICSSDYGLTAKNMQMALSGRPAGAPG